MFEKFPKIRNPLPKEYQEIYEQFYKSNRNGETTASGLAQKMEQWLHKKIAKDTKGTQGHKTLEIGAGTLNQLKFESDFSHYDVIEPFSSLYTDSPNLSKVHRIYNDITEVASEYGVLKAQIGGGTSFKPTKPNTKILIKSYTL